MNKFPMKLYLAPVMGGVILAAFLLLGGCADPVAGVAVATPPDYTILFEDDFERPDSDSLGNGWGETENQGNPYNAVYLQSGKAVFLGGKDVSGGCIVPQARYQSWSLNGPHSRITVDLDQTLSTTLMVWVNINYSYVIDPATDPNLWYIGGYSLTATKVGTGDVFEIEIQNHNNPGDRIYNSDAFPIAATDSLSLVIERDGSDLTLTLVNNTTGASKSVSLPGDPHLATDADQIVLCGGGLEGSTRLATAIESFRVEMAE